MASASKTSLHSSPSASFSSTSTTSSSNRERASKSDASLSSSTESASINSNIGPRSVHFNERCILIPEQQRSPLVPSFFSTKALEVSIPWRWPSLGPSSPPMKEREREVLRSNGGGDAVQIDQTNINGCEEGPSSPRSPGVVLKVPYPVFRRKSYSQTSSAGLRSCLRHSTSQPNSTGSPTLTCSKSPDSDVTRRKPRRSVSLPPLPLDPKIETIPLRPCCEKCLSACEVHWSKKKRLPTLKESSREHTPSHSRIDLCEDVPSNTRGRSTGQSDGVVDDNGDWCAGLHFTKGAYKLWRSASLDNSHVPRRYQERSGGLLGSLVRVDEVDRKRGSSPNASVSTLGTTIENGKDTLALNIRGLGRVKGADRLAPPSPNGNRSPMGSDNASEEELFPLPSPKRLSPAASPSDSATCLPAQISSSPGPIVTEPRYLEVAIRAKMAAKEREKEREAEKTKMRAQVVAEASTAASASGASAPIPIPGAQLKEGVSHFRSHLDDIKWDPSLPDPDALPPVHLNSPPGSPPFGPSSPSSKTNGHSISPTTSSGEVVEDDGWTNIFPLPHIANIPHPHIPRVSVSLPSLSLHLPDIPIPHISTKKRGSVSGSGPGVPSEHVAGTASSTAVNAPSPAENSTSNPVGHERKGSGSVSRGSSNTDPNDNPTTPSTSPVTSKLERAQTHPHERSSPERTRGPTGGRIRRGSLSNIMRASVGVLKGLSLGATGPGPAGVGVGAGAGASVGSASENVGASARVGLLA